MKKYLRQLGSLLAAAALFVGITSVNSPSAIFYHQPKVPEAMSKYKK